MQADTGTLPFPARFSSICYNYNSLPRERARVGHVRVHVCCEVQMPPRYEQTGYNMLG